MASQRSVSFVVAAGLGAALMYLLDPQHGRRRVALLRGQWTRVVRKGRDSADAGWRDLANRASGLVARARGAWRAETPDDDVLVERVRAELGRWVSHPHAIEVSAVGLLGHAGRSDPGAGGAGVAAARCNPCAACATSRTSSCRTPGTSHVPALQAGGARGRAAS
jgi:hypothetical protein